MCILPPAFSNSISAAKSAGARDVGSAAEGADAGEAVGVPRASGAPDSSRRASSPGSGNWLA